MENTRTPPNLAAQETAIRKDAGLVALWALFVFLFGDPFAALVARLQALMAAWRAGELPPPVIRAAAPRRDISRQRAQTARRSGVRVRARAVCEEVVRRVCVARPQSRKLPASKARSSRIERPPKQFLRVF